jgi:cytochrome c5
MLKKLGWILLGAVSGIAFVVACEQRFEAPKDAGLSFDAGCEAAAAPGDCPNGWHVKLYDAICSLCGTGELDTQPGEEPFGTNANNELLVRSCR